MTAAHGEMARGREGDGDGLLPAAPHVRVKSVSDTIPVRWGADGAGKDVKPQQEPLTDRRDERTLTLDAPRTVLGICDMGNVGSLLLEPRAARPDAVEHTHPAASISTKPLAAREVSEGFQEIPARREPPLEMCRTVCYLLVGRRQA